jgi:hypothetical protein
VLWIFIALKNPLPLSVFQPANLGFNGKHASRYTTKDGPTVDVNAYDVRKFDYERRSSKSSSEMIYGVFYINTRKFASWYLEINVSTSVMIVRTPLKIERGDSGTRMSNRIVVLTLSLTTKPEVNNVVTKAHHWTLTCASSTQCTLYFIYVIHFNIILKFTYTLYLHTSCMYCALSSRFYNPSTERCGQVVSTPCSYEGKSRVQISAQRPAILTEATVVFLSPSRQILG